MTDRIGQVLDGKYRLDRLLGAGGMGIVYEAEHLVLHRRCAVKFLHAEVARNADSVKRFVREAQAASAIGHPGIIDIHDVGVDHDGGPYLVMEFLEGTSLASELARERRLSPAPAVEIVVQALAALAHAHRQGIIHRDLKPDNLFLTGKAGSRRKVKILDFGISRVVGGPAADEHLTRTGTVVGTPLYMSPEQAGGSDDLDQRLDLYAMGVLLYECLTGRLPFEEQGYNRLILQIVSGVFPRPRELDPEIPAALEAVVLKAMAHDRDERYGSAEEMIQALVPFVPPKVLAKLDLPIPGSVAPPPPSAVAATVAVRSRGPVATPAGAAALRSDGGRGNVVVSGRRSVLPWIVTGVAALIAAGSAFIFLTGRGDGTPEAASPSAVVPPDGMDAEGSAARTEERLERMQQELADLRALLVAKEQSGAQAEELAALARSKRSGRRPMPGRRRPHRTPGSPRSPLGKQVPTQTGPKPSPRSPGRRHGTSWTVAPGLPTRPLRARRTRCRRNRRGRTWRRRSHGPKRPSDPARSGRTVRSRCRPRSSAPRAGRPGFRRREPSRPAPWRASGGSWRA
jgi:serine/threonine protein kinase